MEIMLLEAENRISQMVQGRLCLNENITMVIFLIFPMVQFKLPFF